MKKQSLTGLTCLLALGPLLLAGCTTLTVPDGENAPAPGSATFAPPSPSPSALRVPGLEWPEGPDFVITRLNPRDAKVARPGTDYLEQYDTKDLAQGGRTFVPFAVTDKGSLVGSTGKQENYDPELGMLHAVDQVGTYSGGKFSPFTAAGSGAKAYHPKPVAHGSATEAGTVWAELDGDAFSDGVWKIMGVPAGQQTARVLATSKEAGVPASTPFVYGMPAPIIANNRVYWHTAFPAETNLGPEGRILSTPLAGGKDLKIERREAYAPVNFGPDVAVLDSSAPVSGQYFFNDGISLIEPSRSDTALVRLSESAPDGQSLESLGAAGKIFSFTYLGDFYIVNTASGKVVSIPLPNTAQVAHVAHCGDRVTWSLFDHDSGPTESRYVYNAMDASLRVLTNPAFAGPAQCGGDYMSWTLSSGKGKKAKTWDVVTRWEN